MTDKKNNKVGFSRKIPSSLSSFHLTADRSVSGMTVTLSGIIGVKDFTDEGIQLSSHGGRIFISGKNLNLEVYENKIIEISGMIGEISFGKNKD